MLQKLTVLQLKGKDETHNGAKTKQRKEAKEKGAANDNASSSQVPGTPLNKTADHPVKRRKVEHSHIYSEPEQNLEVDKENVAPSDEGF